MKDNTVIIPVIEPRDVDNFLDNGVSIWILWNPPEIEFLLTDGSQFSANGNGMRRTR